MGSKSQCIHELSHIKGVLRKVLANLYVFPYSEVGDEVVELEYESQIIPSVLRQLCRRKSGYLPAINDD